MTQKHEHEFEEAVREVRRQELDPSALSAAGSRVWNAVQADLAEADVQVETIRGCGDIRALLPAYSRGALAGDRALLIRDHLRECSACSRFAQTHSTQVEWNPAQPTVSWSMRQFAVAAMLLLVVGLSSFGIYSMYFAPVPGSRARVESVEGTLLAVNSGGDRLLKAGDEIGESDTVRTLGGSHAFLRLRDNSIVEVNERAEFSVVARRNDTTVQLERGSVIVQAAKRKTGHLYVKGSDYRVAVTGTVFSVNSGTRGSRVSVVEGEVHVNYADQEAVLHAGDQVATTPGLVRTSVVDEISWSRNLQQHLALLSEFSKLEDRLHSVQLPQLRYDSKLFKLVPSNALVYVSIPNYGQAITQASDIFQQQLAQSSTLREWWQKQNPNGDAELNRMVSTLKEFSEFVGEEMVVTIAPLGRTRNADMLLIAEVKRAGLKEFIESQKANAGTEDAKHLLVLTPETLGSARSMKGGAYALVTPNMFLFSPNLSTLQWAYGLSQAGGNGFPGTEFGQRVSKVYQGGAGILVAANLGTIIAQGNARQSAKDRAQFEASGLADTRYLVIDRKDVNGKSDTRVSLDFSGERRGMASWLAAPAAMGSLEYVTPEASAVVSAIAKSPALMLDDVFAIASTEPKFKSELAKDEAKLGFSIREDLAASLGGDVAFALDGPMLPIPSWKLVAEVNDPLRLQATLEKLAARAIDKNNQPTLKVTTENVDGRTFYQWQLLSAKAEQQAFATVHYTFADGYLVAAPTRAMVIAALKTRASGNSITASAKFRALLPSDSNANCSAIAYQNLSTVIQPLLGVADEQQSQKLRELAKNSEPTLLCAYGQRDRIEMATNSRFIGLDFNTMALATLLEGHHEKGGTSK